MGPPNLRVRRAHLVQAARLTETAADRPSTIDLEGDARASRDSATSRTSRIAYDCFAAVSVPNGRYQTRPRPGPSSSRLRIVVWKSTVWMPFDPSLRRTSRLSSQPEHPSPYSFLVTHVSGLPQGDQRILPVLNEISRVRGIPLGRRVLDFGAGSGRHVSEMRASGFDAVGVDVAAAIAQASRDVQGHLHRIDPPDFTLPFGPSSFDTVFSTTVMEHVTNPRVALQEISRVLKPGGLAIHVFPSRWRPVEPHIHVPLGGRISNYWWYRLWAATGIRNNSQVGLSATATALMNAEYAKTSLSYPTAHEWTLLSRDGFNAATWEEAAFIRGTSEASGISAQLRRLSWVPGLHWAYRSFDTRVLVLTK